ncbi:MAG TPA: Ig-like domain repeat protein [Terracidiphilus sp.]
MSQIRWTMLSLALAFGAATAAATQSANTSSPCSNGIERAIPAPPSTASRLAGEWRSSARSVLAGSKPPVLRDAVDLGFAAGSMQLDRMILLLEPSAARRQALDAELESQQTPGSCEFHHWLTPQQFAERYANSTADVDAVADWLRSEGFSVAAIPTSRGWLEFSGTAAQVAQAFGAPVHALSTYDGRRFAVRDAISVPVALSSVIHGLASLDGSLATAALTAPKSMGSSEAALAAETGGNAEALTPKAVAAILDSEGLPRGAGESIAIAARSNIRPEDIVAFRSAFKLPANPVLSLPSGPDPGLTADQAAAELQASWAGAAAPAARIAVVPARTTAATDGIDLSLASIVDQSLANTVAIGFSICESALSEAHRAFYAALYRQAAAQGMSTVAATGDSGPAACHAAGNDPLVTTGYAVNALASTPWNTAVGAGALAANGDVSAWSPVGSGDPAYATGGGGSQTYARPNWQPALDPSVLRGVSAIEFQGNAHSYRFGTAAESTGTSQFAPENTLGAQNRLIPDVLLPTALDSALSRGVAFCFSGPTASTGCTLVRSGGSAAAAAIFSGFAAAIAEKNGPQGNLAPRLYALRNRAGVFADVREGAARLACSSGSPGCGESGTIGYDAAKGYDLASGLGVPDASNLIAAWPEAGSSTPTVTLAVSPTQANATYNPQAMITFTATVTGANGTPTGSINLMNQGTGSNLNSTPYTLNSAGVASVSFTGALPQGGNSIVAQYSGDTTYAAQNSQVFNVNIQPSGTTTTVTPSTATPKVNSGFNVTATLTVGNPPAGTVPPTGNMNLTVDGSSYAVAAVSSSGGVISASFPSVKVTTTGSHNLQAVYVGDANYSNSTSSAVSLNAAANSVSVTLTVSPTQANATYNPSAALTFAVAVASTSGGASPTGTVNFLDQATGANLNASAATLSVSGKATVKVTGGLPQGGNGIVAQYSGDTSYPATDSQVLVVNMQPSTTTTTVTPSTTTPAAGVAFPVSVAVAVGTPAAGATAPTGKVNLTLDGAAYASADVSTASGVTSASLNVTLPSGGSHNLQAVYAGDANYATSTSTSVSITAAKGATVTTLTATPATLTAGAPETFTATIAAASGVTGATNTFTGTVTFFDGATQIGTGTISANAAILSNVTLATTSAHTITAVYGGDDNWVGSTSNVVTLKVVLIPVTITLTATPANAGPGQVVTLLATVTPSVAPVVGAEQNPTGNIVFYNGTTILGTVTLSAAATNTATAQLLFATLPAGQNTITAVYLGDLVYATATSNAVTIAVQDFAITPSSSNPPSDLDIVKGNSGTVSYTVAGLGGFNSSIALACAVPAQDDMSCTVNPATVTPTGTVTVTVTTYLTGGPAARVNDNPVWPRAAGGTALAALVFLLLPFGRRARIFSERARRALILLLSVGILGAAGMGCSSVSGSVNGNQGTPLGETTLTITGASNVDNTVVSHSVYLTVNVVPSASSTAQPVHGAN